MWLKVHNLYPLSYTIHVPTINVIHDVHEKRVEGELRAGPHLTSMRWRCGMQCSFKPEKEELMIGELIAQ